MGFWNTELPDWTVEDPWRLVPLPTSDPAELGAVALPTEPPPSDPVPEPLDVPPLTPPVPMPLDTPPPLAPPVPMPLDTPPPLAPPVPWARTPQGVHRRKAAINNPGFFATMAYSCG
jgi:hypothetical protein